MWGSKAMLLTTLIVSMAFAALFSVAQAEVHTARAAQAVVAAGASVLGGEELAQIRAVMLHQGFAESDLQRVWRQSQPQDGDGGMRAGAARTPLEPRDADVAWPWGAAWSQAVGVPGPGPGIPIWDLFAVSAMVVTFGVLVGSWTRKGR